MSLIQEAWENLFKAGSKPKGATHTRRAAAPSIATQELSKLFAIANPSTVPP
jgi:hypothetical protein